MQALQKKGHVVGFMGDGINDAPALRAADVGISVDTAVDIAKESADMILLEKNLMVLEEGVLEGRKVFANILKYIRMGASSNFGNMFSVLGASAWFPFLPMQPIQMLTNNLLYDFSQVPIPTDNVGAQYIAKPRPWQMGEIAKFILFIGPISSIFDYTTFAVMWFYFKCNNLGLVPPPELAARFRRRRRSRSHLRRRAVSTPAGSSNPHDADAHHPRHPHEPDSVHPVARELAADHDHDSDHGASARICRIRRWPADLGFVPLPWQFWPILAVTLLCYVGLTQLIKTWLVQEKLDLTADSWRWE